LFLTEKKEFAMHVTLVHVRVKPDDINSFIAASRANHEASVTEPGNRRFDVLQAPDDPARFILYEAYASAADAAAHKGTAHYIAWREAVSAMMEEPRRGETMIGLFPA
jgi:(4S)-4-hydroxy-5-phosphonooxypentane-2,3-dione isomerase